MSVVAGREEIGVALRLHLSAIYRSVIVQRRAIQVQPGGTTAVSKANRLLGR